MLKKHCNIVLTKIIDSLHLYTLECPFCTCIHSFAHVSAYHFRIFFHTSLKVIVINLDY